jgi:hypothetical protein
MGSNRIKRQVLDAEHELRPGRGGHSHRYRRTGSRASRKPSPPSFPKRWFKPSIVHLLRHSLEFAFYNDCKTVAAGAEDISLRWRRLKPTHGAGNSMQLATGVGRGPKSFRHEGTRLGRQVSNTEILEDLRCATNAISA